MNNLGGILLAGFFALSFCAGGIGGLSTPGEWYQTLERPPLTPPRWVFGPAWALMYTAMGVAAWLVWKSSILLRFKGAFLELTEEAFRHEEARGRALMYFLVQLALNALWPPIFFRTERPDVALVIIIALWCAVAATMIANFWVHRVAGWLLVPCLAWVSFATYLNLGFVIMN